jgi:hypothetical protein
MWPWKRPAQAGGLPPQHEERLADLERGWRKMRLEWEDTFERLDKVMGRLNARARTEARRQEEGDGQQPVNTVDEINRAILEGRFNVSQVRRS